jgi:hypothetical protein
MENAMGFGTLFFGYFLLLNITYFTFTDIISALIMAMGFYKLYDVNSHFRGAFFSSLVFAAIGLFELVIQIIATFDPMFKTEAMLSYSAVARYLFIAVLSLFMLLGIESVAEEVGLPNLARRARLCMPFALGTYAILAILEVPMLESLVDIKVIAIIGTVMLLLSFILVIVNLITVYSAYMRICMPEDKDNDITDKPSRFDFVNKHREHTAQKQKEYAEYKLEKLRKKNSKKKK